MSFTVLKQRRNLDRVAEAEERPSAEKAHDAIGVAVFEPSSVRTSSTRSSKKIGSAGPSRSGDSKYASRYSWAANPALKRRS